MRKQYTKDELRKKWDKAAWGYGEKKHFTWRGAEFTGEYSIGSFNWDELVALSKDPYVYKILPVTIRRLKQIVKDG